MKPHASHARETLGTAALVLLLLAVGAAAWSFVLRPPLRVDSTKLAELPHQLGEWTSVDVPLEQSVESMLRADFNLQRAYTHPLGDRVWLYLGYYGTERGGQPEHTPADCYRAHGWEIRERRTLAVDPALRVNEYLVEQGRERHLVHFWFRSYRSTGLLGGFDQTLDRLAGRLFAGRADGSLVRLSTPVADGDLIPSRSRLLHFAAELDQQLAAHWPVESPDGAARSSAQGPGGAMLAAGQGGVPAQARPDGPGGRPRLDTAE